METRSFLYVPVTLCLGKRPLVSIGLEARCTPEPVWIQQIEILDLAGNGIPSHATHTQSDGAIPV
jgi:hypothetical protein